MTTDFVNGAVQLAISATSALLADSHVRPAGVGIGKGAGSEGKSVGKGDRAGEGAAALETIGVTFTSVGEGAAALETMAAGVGWAGDGVCTIGCLEGTAGVAAI